MSSASYTQDNNEQIKRPTQDTVLINQFAPPYICKDNNIE